VLIDARSSSAYAEAHLQGAVSLPLGQAQEGIRVLQGNIPKDTTLIVYCSGFGCPDSFDLGVLLLKAGYVDVLVYEGGFPEWRDAGRPLGGEGH
jgi:rhodanese-related sulfurtransferase